MEPITQQAPRNRAERRKDEKWERGRVERDRKNAIASSKLRDTNLRQEFLVKRTDAVRKRTAERHRAIKAGERQR